VLTPLVLCALLACRMAVGFVFAFAVVGKAKNLHAFRDSVQQLTGLRPRQAALVAPAVMVGEALVAASMVIGSRSAGLGFGSALLLLGAFTAVLALALRRERQVSCACFGRRRAVSRLDLIRNLGVGVPAIAGLVLLVHGMPAGLPDGPNLVSTVGITGVYLAVVLNLGDVVTIVRPARAQRTGGVS
jgi:hypothetical protein